MLVELKSPAVVPHINYIYSRDFRGLIKQGCALYKHYEEEAEACENEVPAIAQWQPH